MHCSVKNAQYKRREGICNIKDVIIFRSILNKGLCFLNLIFHTGTKD